MIINAGYKKGSRFKPEIKNHLLLKRIISLDTGPRFLFFLKIGAGIILMLAFRSFLPASLLKNHLGNVNTYLVENLNNLSYKLTSYIRRCNYSSIGISTTTY